MRWLALTVALLAATISLAAWIYLRDRAPADLPPAPTPSATLTRPATATQAAVPDRAKAASSRSPGARAASGGDRP